MFQHLMDNISYVAVYLDETVPAETIIMARPIQFLCYPTKTFVFEFK